MPVCAGRVGTAVVPWHEYDVEKVCAFVRHTMGIFRLCSCHDPRYHRHAHHTCTHTYTYKHINACVCKCGRRVSNVVVGI